MMAFGNLTVGLGSWKRDSDKSAGHMSKLAIETDSLDIVRVNNREEDDIVG